MASLSIVASKTVSTLYPIEEHLTCLLESEATVSPEQEEEFVRDLTATLAASAEKCDRLSEFLGHLESQANFATSEIDRLTARREMFRKAIAKVEEYVIRVLDATGRDIEGRTVTFSVRRCPPKVHVSDTLEVPSAYKTIAIKLPCDVYEKLLDDVAIDVAYAVMDAGGKVEPDKRSIKAAIQSGAEVPGASLTQAKALVRR